MKVIIVRTITTLLDAQDLILSLPLLENGPMVTVPLKAFITLISIMMVKE